MSLAVATENSSEHPLAAAIVDFCWEKLAFLQPHVPAGSRPQAASQSPSAGDMSRDKTARHWVRPAHDIEIIPGEYGATFQCECKMTALYSNRAINMTGIMSYRCMHIHHGNHTQDRRSSCMPWSAGTTLVNHYNSDAISFTPYDLLQAKASRPGCQLDVVCTSSPKPCGPQC